MPKNIRTLRKELSDTINLQDRRHERVRMSIYSKTHLIDFVKDLADEIGESYTATLSALLETAAEKFGFDDSVE